MNAIRKQVGGPDAEDLQGEPLPNMNLFSL